ncbi:hypothetical protein GCM10027343_41840 [Noviherbaspirillum agri]
MQQENQPDIQDNPDARAEAALTAGQILAANGIRRMPEKSARRTHTIVRQCAACYYNSD